MLRQRNKTNHQVVDGNASVARHPVSAVCEGTEEFAKRRGDQSLQSLKPRLGPNTHAEALSVTPWRVIFPGTLLETRSSGLTSTSSRRTWYCVERARRQGWFRAEEGLGRQTYLIGSEHVLVEDVHRDLDEGRVGDPAAGVGANEDIVRSLSRGSQTCTEGLTFRRDQQSPLGPCQPSPWP